MKKVQDQVPFDVGVISDQELASKFYHEMERLNARLGDLGKPEKKQGRPNVVKRKERRKAQKESRSKCLA